MHKFGKKHATTSISLTFKIHHWKYEAYNTATSHCNFDSFDDPVHCIFMTQCQLLNGINVLTNSCLTLFTTAGFAVRISGLINLHQQLTRWWETSFGSETFWYTSSLHNHFIDATLKVHILFIFYYIHNSHVWITWIQQSPTKTCLYWYLKWSLQNLISPFVDRTFMPNYVYIFPIKY